MIINLFICDSLARVPEKGDCVTVYLLAPRESLKDCLVTCNVQIFCSFSMFQ